MGDGGDTLLSCVAAPAELSPSSLCRASILGESYPMLHSSSYIKTSKGCLAQVLGWGAPSSEVATHARAERMIGTALLCV